MKTSSNGIDIIKASESFSAKMYLCPAGLPTIGFGTLIDTEEESRLKTATIDFIEGERLLRKDLEIYEKWINIMVKVPLNQNQFDALISLIYNIGREAFRGSSLLRLINKGIVKGADVKKSWLAWNKARVRGELVVLPGLTIRRNNEFNLFIK